MEINSRLSYYKLSLLLISNFILIKDKKIMEILTSMLPSGGFGYDFGTVSLEPMTFLEMSKYVESVPSDPIEKYLYDIRKLIDEDHKILNCYVMDVDFLIFYKKLISVSDDFTYTITLKCPTCGSTIKKKISLKQDIHFKQIDEKIMNGAIIELGGNKYEAKIPTVEEFLKVLETILRYNRIHDLSLIKTVALIGDFNVQANDIQRDVLGATREDITLLLALRELYYDRLEPLEVYCPKCNAGLKQEERRPLTVSVDSLIVDFFRDICINSPIDGTKILFK